MMMMADPKIADAESQKSFVWLLSISSRMHLFDVSLM